eukprot:768614-Hanusia_phi.AAC.1
MPRVPNLTGKSELQKPRQTRHSSRSGLHWAKLEISIKLQAQSLPSPIGLPALGGPGPGGRGADHHGISSG